jgi:hypothetical protein
MEIRVTSAERIRIAEVPVVFDSGIHWKVRRSAGSTIFEFTHPRAELPYCRTAVSEDFAQAEVLLSESAWRELSPDSTGRGDWDFPHPLDQLLLVPALAARGAILLHACGAVVSNRALVFAGHSGDGKTTLARLLAAEGLPLLSDERIGVRLTEDGFMAHGTPWPGEGNVVSNAAHRLAGLFVLRKAPRHGIEAPAVSPGAELLARAIVPFYLPETVRRILELRSELASRVLVSELHFAKAPGIGRLLKSPQAERRASGASPGARSAGGGAPAQ